MPGQSRASASPGGSPDRPGGKANPGGRTNPGGAGRSGGSGGRPGGYRRPPPDPARRAAYDLLRAVRERDAYANLTLPPMLRERQITGRDAAFATELGYGTLRAQGTLDAVLAACVDRPLAELDPPVQDLLRLGVYQLLRTRVPSHAAVSATVDLARAATTDGPARFVNAVLRRVAERDWDAWVEAVAPEDPIGRLAIAHPHPRWIVQAFRDALGGDLAETDAALAADDARPAVHLVARPGRISRTELLEQSGGKPGPWSPYAVRLDGGDPGAVAAVRDGRAAVQDEGSQLVAIVAATAPVDGSDTRWAEVAAGPGGKAALLGALAAGRGARLVAVELAPHRAQLVERAVAGLPVDVRTGDGREVGRDEPGTYDRVLVDAPCTGLGALRRRPEARWRRQPSDVATLARLQRELLLSAIAAVRVGGVVTYATCSPHVAETLAVVGEAARKSQVQPVDVRPLLPGLPDLGTGPAVQLWPHRHGTDAMFIAVLRRTG